MSFLNKMMAAVGIGAARVDTRLQRSSIRVGEPIEGVIVVQGGKVAQRVERLNLEIRTSYHSNEGYGEHTVAAHTVLTGTFEISPNEVREFPFSMSGAHLPVSTANARIWLVTDADISGGVDPKDHDDLQVLPSAHMEMVVDAAQELGFRLSKTENEFHHGTLVQEFCFVPPYGKYQLSELEMIFVPKPDGLSLILEVDRRTTGFSSLFVDEIEQKGHLFLPQQLLTQGRSAVAAALAQKIQQLS